MTKDEAIEILKEEIRHCREHLTAPNKAPEFYKELGDYCDALQKAIGALKGLEKGKWGSEWFDHKLKIVCSACGCFADKMTYYCPNCGAEMEKTDDES